MHAKLFIVDRDRRYADWLCNHLGVVYADATFTVLDYAEFERASNKLTHDECDLLVLTSIYGDHPEDPRAEGIVQLRTFRSRSTFPAVLVVAEEGNELTAVRALQLGALDYLPKRLLTPERLKTAVRLALRRVERRVSRRLHKLAQSGEHHVESEPQGDDAREFAAVEESDSQPIEDATEAPPDLIPGYTIRSTVGESEKAVVYLAQSDALGREIALKVSLGESDETDGRHLLAREYEAISNIRHPAIVELHDYGVHAGREYLAMEYFPRGDLKARLYNGITEMEALRYVEDIASALRIVHHAGILHRDLKPPNVMLRDNDDVALIDFGLARNLEGGLQSTRTGVLRGSPYYMSPEQALGEQLDARTDIYSLGIIFYEMLTGRKPFAGTSAIEVLQEHVNAPVPQLPERYAHHQPFLARMLAKSRDERFGSAEEVLEALTTARESRAMQSTAA
ncbi:MAG TPA: protein kinase [Steroidobacteraceae bacterium]|nr:protein kinase [Steroidobacteraceae bacterium]